MKNTDIVQNSTRFLRIANGIESFRMLREENLCYVDKTLFLEEFLRTRPDSVTLLTRPRRFGKTLTMNMMNEFFSVHKESTKLFQDLAISRCRSLCSAWMNGFPVLHLSLRLLEGTDFSSALENFRFVLKRICYEHLYLFESQDILENDKNDIRAYYNMKGSFLQLQTSLFTFCKVLFDHWKKTVIVLIDEYDVPIEKAWKSGYYNEMIHFIRMLFGYVFKDNPYLNFAVLTGCLRISKESIFTGLNNFSCYGIDDTAFADAFGFTEEDVDTLLMQAGAQEKKATIRQWYDGYRFGKNTSIYCPWDILQYLKAVQQDREAEPKPYWLNTSGNTNVKDILQHTGQSVHDDFETLLGGGTISAHVIETLTYEELYASKDNLWTLLYLTGYLTKALPKSSVDDTSSLVIPNAEVRQIFQRAAESWLHENLVPSKVAALSSAFWQADLQVFVQELNRLLLVSISYYDSFPEKFYHALLTGIFIGLNCSVVSNLESGHGRSDLLIRDPAHAQAACIEIKLAKTAEHLTARAQDALAQLTEKEYAAPLRESYPKERILCYGIAFYKKMCAACMTNDRAAEDTKN